MRQIFTGYRCAPTYGIGQGLRAMKLIFSVTIVSAIVLFVWGVEESTGQVQERPRLLLRDVAKVTLDAAGKSQISFNPSICRRLGPELCEYFRAHEYGHVNLRHLERGVPTRQAEREADLWAARHASPAAVAAARRYFAQGNGGSRYHGSSQQRAQRLYSQGNPHMIVNQKTSGNSRYIRVRPPAQYSGGSRVAIVPYSGSRANSQPASRIVYRKVSVSYPPTAGRSYVPRGSFNNPLR